MTHQLSDEARAKEIAFIMNADGWPLWPMLPVKRRRETGGWPELGMIMDYGPDLHRSEPKLPLCVRLDNGSVIAYPTAAALLDDGWIVD